ncbi:hypothetical protein AB5N19_01376 [Seiridium cardinale]
MKNFFAISILTCAAIFNMTPALAASPMGVEIIERDGKTIVRESFHDESAGMEKRCRECKHTGQRCTIGDGSCYSSENAGCTWCGSHCKSICVAEGQTCEQWCL